MQPLAVFAIASGVVMVLGASATLILSRRATGPRRFAVNRWHRHGSIPLAAAGLALAAISRSSGQSPPTHDVISGVTTTLLAAALLCALVGAALTTRQ